MRPIGSAAALAHVGHFNGPLVLGVFGSSGISPEDDRRKAEEPAPVHLEPCSVADAKVN